LSLEVSTEALALHRRSIIIDGLVSGGSNDRILNSLMEHGVTAANWSVSGHEDDHMTALMKMEERRWLLEAFPEKALVALTAADIERAKEEGRFACVMGFQGAASLEENFNLLAIFWRLGLRLLQVTYSERNHLGYGCLEPEDRGLTHFGRQIVRDCNRLGILLDVAHVGVKTSLDTIELSKDPIALSHAGIYALRPNPRNARDEVIKALAARGGVIGLAAFSDMVGDTTKGRCPTIEDYINHLDYAVKLVGIDHVGVGLDARDASGGWRWENTTLRRYPEICGGMSLDRHHARGMVANTSAHITDALLRRGYTEGDVQKIMGLNWLRLYRQVWRG